MDLNDVLCAIGAAAQEADEHACSDIVLHMQRHPRTHKDAHSAAQGLIDSVGLNEQGMQNVHNAVQHMMQGTGKADVAAVQRQVLGLASTLEASVGAVDEQAQLLHMAATFLTRHLPQGAAVHAQCVRALQAAQGHQHTPEEDSALQAAQRREEELQSAVRAQWEAREQAERRAAAAEKHAEAVRRKLHAMHSASKTAQGRAGDSDAGHGAGSPAQDAVQCQLQALQGRAETTSKSLDAMFIILYVLLGVLGVAAVAGVTVWGVSKARAKAGAVNGEEGALRSQRHTPRVRFREPPEAEAPLHTSELHTATAVPLEGAAGSPVTPPAAAPAHLPDLHTVHNNSPESTAGSLQEPPQPA